MAQCWIIILSLALFLGCGRKTARMEHPEDPHGRYRDQIEVAQRVLAQYEDWSGRAEWEVNQSGAGWEVIAWRIEHPDAKGPKRYLPWGYSVIELDTRLTAVHYKRKG